MKLCPGPFRIVADLRDSAGPVVIAIPLQGESNGRTKSFIEHRIAVYPQKQTDTRVLDVLAALHFTRSNNILNCITAVAVSRGKMTVAVYSRDCVEEARGHLRTAIRNALVNDRWELAVVTVNPTDEVVDDFWQYGDLQALVALFGIGEFHPWPQEGAWQWPLAGGVQS